MAVDVVYYMLGAGLMGYAIDWMAGTFPRWMLILGGVGLIVGMYRFVKDALALIRQDPGARPPLDPDDPN